MSPDLPLMDIQQQLAAARRDHLKGDLKKALSGYQGVLLLQPEHADALTLSALVLYRQQQTDQAIARIEHVTHRHPQHLQAHASLAQIYQDQADHKRAILYFRHSIGLTPENPMLWSGLALSLSKRRKTASAQQAYERAIELKPDMYEAWNNYGNFLAAAGQSQQAINAYQHCLGLRADFAPAYNNLGVLYQSQQRLQQAKSAFDTALTYQKNDPRALNNLGAILLQERRLESALEYFQRAIELSPAFIQARVNAAVTLQNLGHHLQARSMFSALLKAQPADLQLQWMRCQCELQAIYASGDALEASRKQYHLRLLALSEKADQSSPASLSALLTMQAYLLPYQGQNDVALQSLAGDFLSRQAEGLRASTAINARRGGALRVGMVSAFFYDHSNWKIPIQGWLDALCSRYETYIYDTGSHDDEITARVRKMAGYFHKGLSASQFSRQIRADQLDVLIYPEIGMNPLSSELAVQRLAPVQCVSWGHPQSSGFPSMDYFLSSDWMEPDDAQRYYRETLIRLPGLSFSWTRPHYSSSNLPVRAEFGLSEHGLVYLCVQNLSKYLPQHDVMLAQILQQLPDMQLVFIAAQTAVTEAFKQRLQSCFAAHDLDVDQRTVFLPRLDRDQYHTLNRLADCFLDTPEWSGCNSSLEALICDVPVITLPGQLMRSRHTLALYRQMQHHDLVARDEAHYIELAVRMGRDRVWRELQRQKISACRHRLESDPGPAEALAELLPALLDRSGRAG